MNVPDGGYSRSAASVPGGVVSAGQAGEPDRRRWFVLGVVGLAQLMIVLDITIMNIALPSAQTALHFSDVDRQWVITGYALAFGSLLLLGGRLGDLFGRKVTFLTGLTGFALASAVGGASTSFTMLITARACQGAFAALLAPAALGLLTTTFSDSRERGRAFGVYGAIAGGGGLVGLLLGGVLTEYLDWRWCWTCCDPKPPPLSGTHRRYWRSRSSRRYRRCSDAAPGTGYLQACSSNVLDVSPSLRSPPPLASAFG